MALRLFNCNFLVVLIFVFISGIIYFIYLIYLSAIDVDKLHVNTKKDIQIVWLYTILLVVLREDEC